MGWILLSILPQPTVAVDEVYRIEKNFFHDDNGNLVLTQVIFWDWDDRCRGWCMFDKGTLAHDLSGWTRFRFDEGDVAREIWSLSFSETFSQHDPELADRGLLPKEQRRPFRGARMR
jgi:hypothetical protein